MENRGLNEKPRMKTAEAVLIVLGILFISFNLRAPITAVGSIIEMISEEYHLSQGVSGMITTIPLIAFAVVSPFVAKVSNKIGHALTMMIGLIFILIGVIVRSYLGAVGLFLGTSIIGVGIAIGNVIIPAIIKLHFSDRVGLITSIYTSGMCIFAAVGAGISVPLAKGLDLGWHHALACWFVLTIITIAIWLPQCIKKKDKKPEPTKDAIEESANGDINKDDEAPIVVAPSKKPKHKKSTIWKSSLAWWVTLYMGTQSLIFYTLVAWLPTIIVSKGLAENFAGNMALMFQLMAIPATLVIPILTQKFKDQRMLVISTSVMYAVGMLLFLFGMDKVSMIFAVILMAIGMGGSISLSIAFISLRSPNPHRASELSGMSQSAGYLIAAVGPALIGFIFDAKASWSIPLALGILTGLIVFLAVCGMFAGTNKTVKE